MCDITFVQTILIQRVSVVLLFCPSVSCAQIA